MKCAEVNCHETASTLSQLELDDARFAVPVCALHDVGDVSVEKPTPASGLDIRPARVDNRTLAESTAPM
ncbi:MAG: hypothetical protein EON53_09455 [Actinomycetales bacterium]|nr:MAG: hypothetical protein EON53_09455 [Actinomycetales bacterium]